MQVQTIGDCRVLSDKCCVLFEAKTGAIHHVHRIVTLVGAAERSHGEMESAAHEIMMKTDKTLRTLVVDAATLALPGRYRVDPASLKLLREEPRVRGKPGAG